MSENEAEEMEELAGQLVSNDELVDPRDNPPSGMEPDEYKQSSGAPCQWIAGDGIHFNVCSKTVLTLPPGCYHTIYNPNGGYTLAKTPYKTEGLIRFHDSNSDKVVKEIEIFWQKEEQFVKRKIPFKRGILMYGPAGSGKSSTIQIVIEEIVKMGGICLIYNKSELVKAGMNLFRSIQRNTPLLILMEDLEAILKRDNESTVLNMLDGVEEVHKTVFLATTNFPDQLGDRIINRPSRFDKRIKVDVPNFKNRVIYFEHMLHKEDIEKHKIDIEKWAQDTKGLSMAHLKELFLSVVMFENPYEESLANLKEMKEIPKIEEKRKVGFQPIGIPFERD